MAVNKDLQKSAERATTGAFERGLDRLRKAGLVQDVPRDVQRAEAKAMLASPEMIMAKVQEVAATLPPGPDSLDRARLIVARQLLKHKGED